MINLSDPMEVLMRKITIVSVCSFLFLFICSVIARVTRGVFENLWVPLVIGIVILTISGIIALIVKDKTPVNIFCSFLSAIAMGFVVRAWYILRDLDNSIFTMAIISLACVLYLWIYFAFIRIPFIRESNGVCVAVTVLYFILSVVGYVILVLRTDTTFVSTLGFYIFLEISFIFAMSLEVNDSEELIRNLTLSTYSVLVAAIIVAVIALMAAGGDGDCDCDCNGGDCCCDGIDCAGDVADHKVAKRKRKMRKV